MRMTDGPITKILLIYTLPILLSQLLQQLYNIADSAIIGHFAGAEALAALGTTGLLLSVIVNFFIGLSAGMSIIAAHLFGHEEYGELSKSIQTCVCLSIISGIFFTIAGLLGTNALLNMLNTPEDIFPAARRYLLICFWGMTPQLVYNVASSILRALGDTKTPLYYLAASSALNILLDAVLVIFFSMGITGVAVATVASQALSAVLTLIKLTRLDDSYKLKKLSISPSYTHEVVVKGLPSGLQAVFMSVSSLVIQTYINSFGYAAMAGMTVYSKVEGFLYYPLFSFGLAITTFISQNDGAGKPDRIKKGMSVSMKLAFFGSLVISAILIFTAKYSVQMFTSDSAVIENALQAIYYNFPFYCLYAVNQVYIGCIRGVGNTAYPMFTSLCSYCIFRVVWCAAIMPHFRDMRVVYTSYDASWIIMIVLLYIGKRLYIDKKTEL